MSSAIFYAESGEDVFCAEEHYIARLARDQPIGAVVRASLFVDACEGWSIEDGKAFPCCPTCGAKTGVALIADDGTEIAGNLFFRQGLRGVVGGQVEHFANEDVYVAASIKAWHDARVASVAD